MPTFTRRGPFVPDQLVQELEDDRVVLFCGAGISMNAGLPSYAGLVAQVYGEIGVALPGKKDPTWLWPDRMLGELEVRSQPGEVRRAVARLLSEPPANLVYHQALLRLARMRRADRVRLVTTNFDTFFEQAAEPALSVGANLHSAPVLPIPRNDRNASWRSIVHLHGRLEPLPSPNDHLVLTSADFGKAYLTDGWAARFVSRLFADFTVLFVGYSLNDPVLRYMMDAFAAEAAAARRHSLLSKAYIFVPYTGHEEPSSQQWKNRGLVPIFYHSGWGHRRLRETLVAWAAAREDWLSSAAAIVRRFGPHDPSGLSPSDASNVIWAVSGRNDRGYGARTFAALPSRPHVGWLHEFARRETDAEAQYRTLVDRAQLSEDDAPPRPSLPLQSLFLSSEGARELLSPVAEQLARWLIRQADDQDAIDWTAQQLGSDRRLHPRVRQIIRDNLAGDQVLTQPQAVFWRIVSTDAPWSYRGQSNAAEVARAFTNRGDELDVRADFLALLRPYITLRPITWRFAGEANANRLSAIVDANVALVGGDMLSLMIDAIDRGETPNAFLAELADELTCLLKAALSLLAIIDKANRDHDPGEFVRPSIRPHPQNQNIEGWTLLIDLLWRAWTHIDAGSASESRQLIQRWHLIPFPIFKRMRLQAMSESMHWTVQEKLAALLDG